MQKPKVLVFLVSNFASSHGGIIWTANLLASMTQVSDMDFFVVSSGPPQSQCANEELVQALGFEHIFLPWRDVHTQRNNQRYARLIAGVLSVSRILLDKYYFFLEREARAQRHIDTAMVEIIKNERPDLIIINSIWPTLSVPSVFCLSIPICFITLNSEVAFHRSLISNSGPDGDKMRHRLERWIVRHGNGIADRRMRRYVGWLYNNCAGIVALTRDDLPSDLPDHIAQAVLPPLLNQSDQRWTYSGSRCLFFVGNILHFPNRLAIEWICRKLAPELSTIDNRIRINIIGADADQLPTSWLQSNVNLLGQGEMKQVIYRMTTDDLFIAPIANPFGAKLKLAECASHGMPFLATSAALSGLRFLTFVPQIDLSRPRIAAELVVEYMDSPQALIDLGEAIATQVQRARAEQPAEWREFLRRSMSSGRAVPGY